jgi:hypothetical protein
LYWSCSSFVTMSRLWGMVIVDRMQAIRTSIVQNLFKVARASIISNSISIT